MPLLVKICGLKTPDALDAALEAGADMVGFVFFPPSPRNLGIEAARALGERVQGRAQEGRAVGRCRPTPSLTASVEALKPDMLQLHGKETPERVAAVRSRFGLPVMKALPIESSADLAPIRLYDKVADRLLFDAPRAARGDAARRARQDRSTGACWKISISRIPFMLSGGLDAGNVAEALRITARAGGRCVVGRRARAGREGPGQDPRLRARRARAGRTKRAWPPSVASTA